VLEQVNAISSSLITSETFKLDETETFTDNWEKVGEVRRPDEKMISDRVF